MITSPPKRGMALVVVLVLLAVMMLVTITLSGRMQQQLGRTRSQQEYQQALWYSASAESLALSALSLSPVSYTHLDVYKRQRSYRWKTTC